MRFRLVGLRAVILSCVVAVVACADMGAAQTSNLRDRLMVLPEPQEVHTDGGVGIRLLSAHQYVIVTNDPPQHAASLNDLNPALADLERRWRAIGIPVGPARIVVSTVLPQHQFLRTQLGSEGYILSISARQIRMEAASAAGRFYAVMTLAQLPQRDALGWYLPNAVIVDWPAMRWRGLHDDVSRGPIPTMTFFKERIRAAAEFKMNLYSPYFEHVFAQPQALLPTPPDAITPAELSELGRYATSYHIVLMPEQETLGHMHHTLEMQRYAQLAEVQHDAVLSPVVAASSRYVAALVHAEAASVKKQTPFFHLGGDEPFVLGQGRSKPLLARVGWDRLYVDYFAPLWRTVREAGMRPVLWSDYLLNHRGAIALLPKDVVVANWQYDARPSYLNLLRPFANAGLQQFVAPGASNWSEIYPNITKANKNVRQFVSDGRRTRHVIGMLETVWHDDGQTLFSETWYPVLYAAAAAWQSGSVDERRFAERFDWAFFGVSQHNLSDDIDSLRQARNALTTDPEDNSDYQFWADPFATYPRLLKEINVAALRLHAEAALEDLLHSRPPPLHAAATETMRLAAMRFDLLGHQLQIAQQFDDNYAAAQAQAGKDDDAVNADLYNDDTLLSDWLAQLSAVEQLYTQVWQRECRPAYLANNLALYDERRANIVRIDKRLLQVINEQYQRQGKTLPARAALF